MHPADQISTLLLYGNVIKISGARYQSVTTTEVSLMLKSYVFAKPKSQILSRPWLETRRFEGLRSRCMMRWECRKSIPFKSSLDSRWFDWGYYEDFISHSIYPFSPESPWQESLNSAAIVLYSWQDHRRDTQTPEKSPTDDHVRHVDELRPIICRICSQ